MLTPFGRGLIDDADAAAGRGTLGLGSAAMKNVGQAGDAVPLCSAGVTFGGIVGATALAVSGANVQSTFTDTSIAGTLPMIHVRRSASNANPEIIRLDGYGNAGPARGVKITFHTPNAGGSVFQGSVGASGTGAGVEIRGPGNGIVARVNDAGIGVLGEVRGDALRIDATPAASAAAATHKLPVSLNGTTYYLLLSSA